MIAPPTVTVRIALMAMLLTGVFAGSSVAQTQVDSFTQLPEVLRIGNVIYVEDDAGKRTKGRLLPSSGTQGSSSPPSREQRYFVGAGVLMDRGYYQSAFTPNSWRPGVTVDAGWLLSARRSLRVSAQIAAWGDRTFEDTDFTLSRDGRVTATSRSRTIVGTAAFGLHHLTNRRVRVASLWGLSGYTSSERLTKVGRDSGRTFSGGTQVSRAPGAAIGLEAAWASSRRTEVVGQVVGHVRVSRTIDGLVTLMPSLVFRWRY